MSQKKLITKRRPIIIKNGDRKRTHILHEQFMDVILKLQNEEPNVIELPPVAEEQIRPNNGILEGTQTRNDNHRHNFVITWFRLQN